MQSRRFIAGRALSVVAPLTPQPFAGTERWRPPLGCLQISSRRILRSWRKQTRRKGRLSVDEKNKAQQQDDEIVTTQSAIELEESDLNDIAGGKYVNKASPDLM